VPVRADLIGVWLHGSLATDDYTGYSDVDALIVVRDAVVHEDAMFRRVRAAIRAALRAVLLFDPLQHHGFFVGVESGLQSWPSSYLPAAALQYARCLWPLSRPVTLCERDEIGEAQAQFQTLVQRLQRAKPPRTLYQAKALLSQFMLLPTLL
jgi:hypothetical protein